MRPDLEKLRRFALAVALVLITYALAGIALKPAAVLSPLGIPFTVERPELLPIGLMLASAYGAFRFYYYGFVLEESAYRLRARWLEQVQTYFGRRPFRMYWGGAAELPQSNHQLLREVLKLERGRPLERGCVDTYPTIGRLRPICKCDVKATVMGDPQHGSLTAKVPRACAWAAALQDIDYSAPIWLNGVALALVVTKLLLPSLQ